MKDCHSMVILLKFLLLLDLLILAASVALAVCYGTLPPHKLTINRLTLIYIIFMLGAYGVVSLLCNCLATYGVKNRIKTFLVPYLIFYPLVVAITTIFLSNSLFSSLHVAPGTLLLPIFFSVVLTLLWLRFVRFWYVLSTAAPRPAGDNLEIGESVWDQVNLDTPSRDQPPAYDSPPGYEEAVRSATCCQEKERK